ncbi:hypothetical protein SCLCIDRAFT_24005 [Scleroderma citrinum Foug A]|uniref:Uncharacterized protein n=1 Tax=Scleroderma citrinum Foug A TaxID=1036808 RepID=A0A0C2ZPT9_9AGAM|nr:hypothetical protein SCLCIDRAFT_30248 [Scleroderma citrinum Foug A]KIM63568.1 hypothetical protein SCLCIDRAFT_24005 [Scleroderma citrinum Foug A]
MTGVSSSQRCSAQNRVLAIADVLNARNADEGAGNELFTLQYGQGEGSHTVETKTDIQYRRTREVVQRSTKMHRAALNKIVTPHISTKGNGDGEGLLSESRTRMSVRMSQAHGMKFQIWKFPATMVPANLSAPTHRGHPSHPYAPSTRRQGTVRRHHSYNSRGRLRRWERSSAVEQVSDEFLLHF